MSSSGSSGRERTAAYLELIYDLIFVFLVGRNDTMLEPAEGMSFFTAEAYGSFLLSTLVILQIWMMTTLYLNRFGKYGLADYIFLFVNMYLLFYLGMETRPDWRPFYLPYHVIWSVLLCNLALQYALKLREGKAWSEGERSYCKSRVAMCLTEAGTIGLLICLGPATHLSLSWIPVSIGFIWPLFTRRRDQSAPVDFHYLSERVMLYVVLTFGEMIVGIGNFFHSDPDPESVYFSLATFLTAAVLFAGYGFAYQRVIARDRRSTGILYVFLHMLLVVAVSNMTVSLEFFLESGIDLFANQLFLLLSMLLYFGVLYLIISTAGKPHVHQWEFPLPAILFTAGYTVIMLLTHQHVRITSAATIVYAFAMFLLMYFSWKAADEGKGLFEKLRRY